MKITQEAKLLIMEGLATNDCDCLQVTLQQSCCGTSVGFSMTKLTEDEEPVSVNGISVMMDNKSRERTETVTLAVENGKLIIQDSASSCC